MRCVSAFLCTAPAGVLSTIKVLKEVFFFFFIHEQLCKLAHLFLVIDTTLLYFHLIATALQPDRELPEMRKRHSGHADRPVEQHFSTLSFHYRSVMFDFGCVTFSLFMSQKIIRSHIFLRTG